MQTVKTMIWRDISDLNNHNTFVTAKLLKKKHGYWYHKLYKSLNIGLISNDVN